MCGRGRCLNSLAREAQLKTRVPVSHLGFHVLQLDPLVGHVERPGQLSLHRCSSHARTRRLKERSRTNASVSRVTPVAPKHGYVCLGPAGWTARTRCPSVEGRMFIWAVLACVCVCVSRMPLIQLAFCVHVGDLRAALLWNNQLC